MALIVLDKVGKSFGGKHVVREASLEINEGDKVGLVGWNGSGKTTLLNLMSGLLEPDTGQVRIKRGLRIGILAQDPALAPQSTAHETALESCTELQELGKELREIETALEREDKVGVRGEKLIRRQGELLEQYQRLGGYSVQSRAEKILHGLGFSEKTWHHPVARLSGGEKNRLCLACLLLTEPELLLLDEPTNYLDIPTATWLEEYLVEFRGAALVISHDRYFLNSVSARIIEIEQSKVTAFRGNYDSYARQKGEKQRKSEKERLQLEEEIRRQDEFIRRNIYGQKSRQAKSRRKLVERLREQLRERAPVDSPNVSLRFSADVESGEEVLRINDISKQFGNRILFRDFSLHIAKGEKVGIIGPNGCGKSTLFRIILGMEPASSGSTELGYRVYAGYYDQEQKNLNLECKVLEEAHSGNRQATVEEVRKVLGRFHFTDEDMEKPVMQLSGGGRGRVLLSKLVLGGRNLLLLDEPTTHLDIPARQVLEKALSDFPGTVIVISHDRFLLNRIVQRLLVFTEKGVHVHTGNYSTYRKRFLQSPVSSPGDGKEIAKKERRRKRPFREGAKEKRIDPYKLKRLEEAIIEKEEKFREVEHALGLEENYRNPSKVKQLTQTHTALREELELLNREWEELIGD